MSDKILNVDLDTIAKLADIVNDKELGEITISDGEGMITLKGRKCPPPPPMGMPMPAMPAAASAPAAEAGAPSKTESFSGNVVRSPIVGTFYAASAPDKPPFVTVGQQVKKGDVVMIIESMKLMNEVQSDFDGVVAEILVKNGEAVEYDQPVMIIK